MSRCWREGMLVSIHLETLPAANNEMNKVRLEAAVDALDDVVEWRTGRYLKVNGAATWDGTAAGTKQIDCARRVAKESAKTKQVEAESRVSSRRSDDVSAPELTSAAAKHLMQGQHEHAPCAHMQGTKQPHKKSP